MTTKQSLRPVDYKSHLTRLALARKPSAIRALQPLVKLPGMISLGGGMPNPETFPFADITVKIKEQEGGGELHLSGKSLSDALQYSPTPGLPGLVAWLKDLQMKEHNPKYGDENVKIMVSTGGQDALTKSFELLVSPEDTIIVEKPTYTGALAFLKPYGCTMASVSTDSNGLVPEELESLLTSWNEQNGKKPRVLYTIPTGSNPSGGSLTLKRKNRIYEICCEHDIIILEDDPYYYLQFGKTRTPSFLSLDTEGRVLRFDSFSKILSSGCRCGFVTGPTELITPLELHAQATILHSSGLSQVGRVTEFYRERKDWFEECANKHLIGMFFWLKLSGINDSMSLIKEKAVEKKVLLVPGGDFMVDSAKPCPYVRAAFSSAPLPDIEEAIKRLSALLKQENTAI